MADAGTDGWALYSGDAIMRCGPGEGDKLARLADVRDWLMDRNEWPMEVAAAAVITGLRKAHDCGLELFVSDAKRYAAPLRPDTHMLSPEEVRAEAGLRGSTIDYLVLKACAMRS